MIYVAFISVYFITLFNICLSFRTPLEFSLHKSAVITVIEVNEGEEKKEIWAAFDSKDRSSYHSLLEGI